MTNIEIIQLVFRGIEKEPNFHMEYNGEVITRERVIKAFEGVMILDMDDGK